jgi:hypothetical protein
MFKPFFKLQFIKIFSAGASPCPTNSPTEFLKLGTVYPLYRQSEGGQTVAFLL